uniref:Ribbon-helix-helix protein, copG family protein n=1 Tax=uncultured Acetothermia bacterium TaxID=236499 RepID=H5SL22_9BACT|nr:ribbon-helix-helix protein, copG family protein [uncultured Acetothermia bacterium]
MPAQTVKVAISLPKEEFRALEKRSRQLKQSRSAVIAKAIRHWLKAQQEAEDVQRYVEGYQKYPETEEEMAEAAALARMALADVEWEE